MPHLLVAGKLHPSGLDLLRQAPVTFDYVEEISEPS
jgi:D-3-phosphoglycerate dehydrogenase / 2-oxoglutarate reductase